ncbi:hypothetical protein CAPTEDRAFT_158042 [Capitella teleta]|uniref:ODAD1 central coiled coil region domain-containing protein n=1 Tax=Capitella teleta TaxID=283909 RepID=R7UYP8_CAPTE|nr:hypothetical protein CAPTEDRAFT_158042 [Capitella teleta]|eukprot:ELU09042.1 hypothetical protein CAPTEDRAFT_158042 [Capitella teleta]
MADREMEYQKLCRQYRLMENDRKAYCQESQDQIKRQRSEIEVLEGEQEEILKNMRLIESRSNQNKDDRNCESLGDLGRKKGDVETSITEERKLHQELDAEIREWEKKLRKTHKNMGGVHMSAAHTHKVSKDVRKMENQLQLSNNSFCKALEVNRKLREEIDDLRVERKRFDQLHKKLDKQRQGLQQEIGEVIDQSTQAYDARDEAQAKMLFLKDKADKDLHQHNSEMKELVRIIDHDRNQREFMNTKGKELQEDALSVAWRQKKEAIEAEKKKASQTDSVESYETAFRRIQEITGEDDIDLLVKRFIEVEDRNFALFNYVNEQNNEKEMLEEQILQVKEDCDCFQKQGVELEAQRQQILKSLEERQVSASHNADESDEKYKEVKKIQDQLKAGIGSLFNKISCDRSAIDDMLGSTQGVSTGNMLQYLGVIEERTNQLLLMQAYLAKDKDYDEYIRKQPCLLGDGPQQAQPQPSFAAPTLADEYGSGSSEESDDESQPMTRNELTNKALRSVKKREQAMKRDVFKYDLSDAREKTKKKDKGKKH